MTKILMAVLFAAFGATAAMAQSSAGDVYLKTLIGGTLSTITKTDDTKMKFGLVGGAELGYQVTDQFAVTAGALVAMQGTGGKDNEDVKDFSMPLTYLNVPVLINYSIVPGLTIKAGIQPGFLLTAKTKYTTIALTEGEKDEKSDTDVKDLMEKFDLSIPVGIAYEFDDFVIDARYNIGLTKILKTAGSVVEPDGSNISTIGNSSARNSVFMLTFGYKVPL